MKTKSLYSLAAVAALALGAVATSCQDSMDAPGLQYPEADHQANMTILDLKQLYWDDATNYIDTIRTLDGTEDGEHIYISGRVISSDASGNIYKSLVIQDATAALAMSINLSNLYQDYRIGQEVVIDVTGMYIGKYNGLQQLGYPEWYASGNAWEATFMPYQFFKEHIQLNGIPEPAEVDTLRISYSDISSTASSTLTKYQSQLVRFDNCHFEGGGELTFTDAYKTTSNRTLVLSDGNSMTVRTSGYSDFWSDVLPEGDGTVVGILSYYGSSGWQLLLNGRDGYFGFGEESDAGAGTEDNPWTVAEAIAYEEAGYSYTGWVTGYIVGAVNATGTTNNVASAADIDWSDDVEMPNTLVIGQTADSKSLDEVLVVVLPAGTAFREYGNLVDNPSNYGKQIWVRGMLSTVLGTYGVANNNGTTSEFTIEGVETGISEGDGTASSPYSASQALSIINNGTYTSDKVYIKGVISQIDSVDTSYGNATYYISDDGTTTSQLEVYRGYYLDGAKFTSSSQIAVGDVVVIYGELTMYYSTPEVTTGSSIISINGETGSGSSSGDSSSSSSGSSADAEGQGTESDPYNCAMVQTLDNPGTTSWVEGYIVGSVDGMTISSGCIFSATTTVTTNLLIADSVDCTDYTQCVPVQLPSGTIRTALNLADNSGNYGKKVKLQGSLEKYFSVNGVKSVTDYSWAD